jgi:hypothetical protein
MKRSVINEFAYFGFQSGFSNGTKVNGKEHSPAHSCIKSKNRLGYIELLSGNGLVSKKFWELEERIRQDKKSPGCSSDFVSARYTGISLRWWMKAPSRWTIWMISVMT